MVRQLRERADTTPNTANSGYSIISFSAVDREPLAVDQASD